VRDKIMKKGVVLVVDDDKVVCDFIGCLLEDAGYEVYKASSGEEALSNLGGIEIVLTDLFMPDMDGLELAGRIKAIDETIPVIVMTALPYPGWDTEALEKGAFSCLTKPFTLEEALSSVEEAFAWRRSLQAL